MRSMAVRKPISSCRVSLVSLSLPVSAQMPDAVTPALGSCLPLVSSDARRCDAGSGSCLPLVSLCQMLRRWLRGRRGQMPDAALLWGCASRLSPCLGQMPVASLGLPFSSFRCQLRSCLPACLPVAVRCQMLRRWLRSAATLAPASRLPLVCRVSRCGQMPDAAPGSCLFRGRRGTETRPRSSWQRTATQTGRQDTTGTRLTPRKTMGDTATLAAGSRLPLSPSPACRQMGLGGCVSRLSPCVSQSLRSDPSHFGRMPNAVTLDPGSRWLRGRVLRLSPCLGQMPVASLCLPLFFGV